MPPKPTKSCAACHKVKALTEFYRSPTGWRSYCKACTSAKRKAAYAADHHGRAMSYEQLLQREYGITLEQYEAKLRSQAHRCAICRRPESVHLKRNGDRRRLAVDHDHVTGAVRGLLCQRCNILVWALEDNHTTLDAIRVYIEAFRESFANGAPL